MIQFFRFQVRGHAGPVDLSRWEDVELVEDGYITNEPMAI
jgi:hypothetical protein